jgi:hypothetical protein
LLSIMVVLISLSSFNLFLSLLLNFKSSMYSEY